MEVIFHGRISLHL
nr:unnamed protein product [Callosobruchus analis]